MPGEIAATLQHARLRLALHTGLHTGLRKGGLCGLRWCELDRRSRRLTVARGYRATPKSEKHQRWPIWGALEAELRAAGRAQELGCGTLPRVPVAGGYFADLSRAPHASA